MQFCVEKLVFNELVLKERKIRNAINTAQAINLSALPSEERSDLTGAFKKAGMTFELIKNIKSAERIMTNFSVAYLPIHVEVRKIQKAQARIKVEIKILNTELRLMSKDPTQDVKRENLKIEITAMEIEIATLTKSIPKKWAQQRKKFVKLKKTSTKARQIYRRNVDDAYGSLMEVSELIKSTSDLAGLKGQFATIDKRILGKSINNAQSIIKELVVQLRSIPGTGKITKELSNGRRALRRKKAGEEKAQQFLAKAKKKFLEELSWRKRANLDVKPGLDRYQEVIRDTIGLRLQTRLPHDQALAVASCKSNPLDLTLSF